MDYMGENKKFDEWNDVDCNECSHYWDNSCDGTYKASQKPCNSFLATRSVVIPEQIKSLQNSIKWLSASTAMVAIGLLIHILESIL